METHKFIILINSLLIFLVYYEKVEQNSTIYHNALLINIKTGGVN